MSDIDLGASLSPEENQYFETGGNSEIPAGSPPTSPHPAGDDGGGGGAGGTTADAGKGSAGDRTAPDKLLAAVHEERGRRKTVEGEKRALENQLAELRGKFSIIERLQPAVHEAPVPTVENDIFGVVRRQGETIAQFEKRFQDQDNTSKADADRQKLVTAYQMDAAQFEQKTPDFKAAYSHLLNSRAAELQAMGYDDPMQLHQALTNDEIAIAQSALTNRKSAAEIIYNLAQQRGYKKADPNPGGKGAEKIETINRGQNANKTLSNAGGNSGDGDVTADMLLKMPMDEFEAWCSKNPAKAKRLMGG